MKSAFVATAVLLFHLSIEWKKHVCMSCQTKNIVIQMRYNKNKNKKLRSKKYRSLFNSIDKQFAKK